MYHNKKYLIELTKEFPHKQIDFGRLIHVTYNIETEEIKLYTISDNLEYLKKYTTMGQENQYIVNNNSYMLDDYKERVVNFLGYQPDFNQIIIDVVTDDVVYFYTDRTGFKEFEKLDRKSVV